MLPSRATLAKFYSDVTANGGVALCTVDWIAGTLDWQDAVSGATSSSRGYARLQLRISSPAVQHAAIMNVLRIDDFDANGVSTTWEYRITQLADSKGPTVTVTCAPILEDAGRFQMRSVAGGVPSKLVTFTNLSPVDILADVVVPAMVAGGMTGVVLGTVDPVGLYSFAQRDQTPLSVVSWLEGATSAECWLDRTSETVWTLNLGTRGASAATPVAHVGRNVTALDRTIIVDANFANRIDPEGVTASDETEPTTLAETQWAATGTSGTGGRTVALGALDAGDGPIVVDGQLDGLEVLTANLPLCSAAAPSGVVALTFDTTRRFLWWIDGTETLRWRDVESDAVGSVNLAQGGTAAFMGYDSSVDRLVVAYSNLPTVLLVNPATLTITANLGTTSNPLSLSVIPALSRAYVSTTGSSTLVVNTSAGTAATWASGPGGGSVIKYFYHAASTRIVTWVPGSSFFSVWASPAGASVGFVGTGGVPFAMADDPSQTTMGMVQSGALNWGTATISGTPSFSGFAAMPAAPSGITLIPNDVLRAGGRYYISSGHYIVGWTGSAYTGTTGQNVGDMGGGVYALERGPTTSETSNLFVVDPGACIRRLALTVDCSAFEHWTVSNSNAANQTIDMPASGSGGPVRIPTAAGFHARIQFRDNASLDLLTRLIDPASVALYGAIDATPSVSVLGKGNYYRGGTFDEWRSDDTHRWMSESGPGAGTHATRFRASEASPVTSLPCTFGASYTTPATSATIAGFAAGQILQPGDTLTAPGLGAVSVITQRAVANGSGVATVACTALGGNQASGDAVLYTQPDLGTLPNGRTDCPALYRETGGAFGMVAAVPRLTGSTVAWVTAHVKIACYGGTPNTNQLTARDPFATTDHAPVVPAQAGDGSAQGSATSGVPVVVERWLSQRIDLATAPGHGLVRFTLTPGGSCVLYVISLSVMLAADALADTTNQTGVNDLYDSEGPRALWRTAAARLAVSSSPSVQYQCAVIEDNPAAPFVLGATCLLRDPARGIAARPRLVAVTRHGVQAGQSLKQPEIELSNLPTSLLRQLVDLQTVTQNIMQGAA